MYQNRGEDPDGEALQQYVQQETQELIDHLHAMQKTYENAKDATEISEADLKTIIVNDFNHFTKRTSREKPVSCSAG